MEAATHSATIFASHNNTHPHAGKTVPVSAEAAAGLPWQTTEYAKSTKILALFMVSSLLLFFLSGSFILKQKPKTSQKKAKQAVTTYYYPQ